MPHLGIFRALFFTIIFVAQFSWSQTGSILREYWSGISGTTVANLTGSASFQGAPTGTSFLTSFEAPANWNDNYGTRIRGYVHPPTTGNYIFWIASDDNSELWLSTDDKQSRKIKIASVDGYTSSQQWTKYPSQQSSAIYLVAGQRYYIEVLHKEGTSNDNCAVGWQLPNATYERPIPGNRLSPVTDNDDYSLWSDTTRIKINTTANGANVVSNVYEFPILVRLSENNFDFTKAKNDGSDIRFAKANGTHLPFQIELWDAVAKKANVWVKLDTVYANDSTHFFTMLWGKSDAVSRSSAGTVFDTLNGFRGVWHLQQSPLNSPPQMTDGTFRNNHGTLQGGMNIADQINGMIGYGLDFDGTDDYISTTIQSTNPQTFTTSFWFKTATTNGGMLLGFGSNQTGASSSKDRQVWLDTLGKINFGVWSNNAQQTIKTAASFNDAVWHFVTTQLSSSGMKLYVDGILQQSNSSITSAASYAGYWRIGYDNMAGWTNIPKVLYTLGQIDEVAISHTARSDAWIKLLYANQKNGSTFLTIPTTSIKPLVQLVSHIAAVAETSITVIPVSISATIAAAQANSLTLQIGLTYNGTATSGIDYNTLPSMISLSIPAGTLTGTVPVSLTPLTDALDEGNEFLSIKLLSDTTFRLGTPDSVIITITDNDQRYPPHITQDPSELSLMQGDVGMFEVEVEGSTPFSFIWRKNGVPISGAPNSGVYTIPPAPYSDSGALYSCIVMNSVGSDTSLNARLRVALRPEAPRILRQPFSQTITEGDTAKFAIVVAGTPPFTWQWYCGTSAISGATDSVLSVAHVSMIDNGKRYYCQVTNNVAGILSSDATLTVRKPSSQTLIITGDLFSAGYDPVGNGIETDLDFTIKLYPSLTGGSVLYTETFFADQNQSVKVKDGKFALQLGSGTSAENLTEVVRTNANLFISFTISRAGGNPETLDRRVPLTSSPYALSALPHLLKGSVNPNSASIEAPIGTHYLQTTNDSTYIKTARGWAGLQ